MSTPAERLAALEQRLGDHEARCEERLAEIKATTASTLNAVEGLKGRSWGVACALLAWALAQIWSANAARFEQLEAAKPAPAAAAPGIRLATAQAQPTLKGSLS